MRRYVFQIAKTEGGPPTLSEGEQKKEEEGIITSRKVLAATYCDGDKESRAC
jgi:hypothetical protein